ncbi:unnamed protein product [Spirodela intermedia]|uniref:DNA replication ATP-dependent helicase/nuclease n=1 Tax=Spirodela intermedia TaxID=51605 RepID=A0A7I8LBM3_SPIIN|nr:unnamed protein product [Spirodela intermedia]
MGPRKRAVSASSSRKPNQNLRQSQPAKFGIQHFFERHSQAAAAAAVASSDASSEPASSSADSEAGCGQCAPPPGVVPPEPSAAAPQDAEEEGPSPISPEVTKGVSVKRFRFSPRMLIKQSQDDGEDEVTWKISPVNQRLRSLTTKTVQDGLSVPPIGLKQNISSLRSCSQEKVLGYSRNTFSHDISQRDGCEKNGDSNIVSAVESQTTFRTPPSVSYGPLELGSTEYRKVLAALLNISFNALLELLDQVEGEIAIDGSTEAPRKCVIEGQMERTCKINTSDEHKAFINTSAEMDHNAYCSQNLLVLEVTEEHRSIDSSNVRESVLRLLNERSGEEQALYLCDEWFYSLIGPGDTVNVIGEFDGHERYTIDRNYNLIIVHPHILVSGTRVASSFSCPRRSVLDERLKINEHSTPALIGTLLHQVFQAGLLKDSPTRAFMEEYVGALLQQNVESLYACGVGEGDTYLTLVREIPRMLNWIKLFRDEQGPKKPMVDFGQYDGEKSIAITEVMDIEEMAQAPRYGLKGMIDASLHIKMGSFDGGASDKIIPLEFKTGKATIGQALSLYFLQAAIEHRAQVILYTLLMSERYQNRDVDSGLIYYLHTDQTLGIKVQRSDLIGIIMRRNELATDILKASTVQILPPMLRSPSICKSCRHLNICTVYHKAHGGDSHSSGLDELFNSLVDHLTISHGDFLRHWDRLIDLESKASSVAKREALHPSDSMHDRNGLSSLVLDVSKKCSVDDLSKNRRYIYHFVCNNAHSEVKNKAVVYLASSPANSLDCNLRCGDYVVLSTESGYNSVANGVIVDISHFNVSVALARRLRLPGSISSSDENNLANEIWRIDKDEVSSSYAVMRFNLIQLFLQNQESSHLRKMIVDLEAPMFDSGGIVSQDPAISYVRSEVTLNDDQRRAIHKMLYAKDYALILGMPGTGKTSTLVHAVKALLIRGASILLTSYTNSAVDNLLLKLKAKGIDFIRIGRQEAVHCGIREHCLSGKQSLEDVRRRMEHVRVVGVTCLGINHPLLAKRKFDVCIMDEAGQTTLPVSLGPLMLAKKFVLVGDHYQLPPLVQSTEAEENGMGISLFCRLSEAHPQAIAALQCQYRMCAGIMELSNALIYGNRLRCGSPDIANAKIKISSAEPLTSWLKEVLDPDRSVIFINTDELSAFEVKAQKAINNPIEANIVSEIVEELIKRDVAGDDIGVITPYNAQVDLIRSIVGTNVEIHTIDKYQGRDKDCILVSFVRSSEQSTRFGTSLLGDWHRINVALTRPKKKLIMVGSCRTLSRIPLLKLLIEKVSEGGGILTVSDREIRRMKLLKRCGRG